MACLKIAQDCTACALDFIATTNPNMEAFLLPTNPIFPLISRFEPAERNVDEKSTNVQEQKSPTSMLESAGMRKLFFMFIAARRRCCCRWHEAENTFFLQFPNGQRVYVGIKHETTTMERNMLQQTLHKAF